MPRAPTKAFITLILALLMSTISCVVTPVPEPPDLDPPDPDFIVMETHMTIFESEVFITGEPRAAEPGATIWAVALASTSAPIEETVADDGSFNLIILASGNTEIRLQLRSPEGLRSDPIDLLAPNPMDSNRGAVVIRDDCLVLTPSLELDLGVGSEGSISIHNTCGADVVVESIDLRVPTPSFEILDAPPITIADGESASVGVRFDPQETGLIEEILLIGVGAPLDAQWPVTLFGVGN